MGAEQSAPEKQRAYMKLDLPPAVNGKITVNADTTQATWRYGTTKGYVFYPMSECAVIELCKQHKDIAFYAFKMGGVTHKLDLNAMNDTTKLNRYSIPKEGSVFWEWQEDDGHYVCYSYKSTTSKQMEAAFIAGKPTYSVVEKQYKFAGTVTFSSMQQTGPHGGIRKVRRIQVVPHPVKLEPVWLYQEDDGSYVTFDEDDRKTLELAYAAKQIAVAIRINGCDYDFDLKGLKQTNRSTKKNSKILRLEPPLPAVPVAAAPAAAVPAAAAVPVQVIPAAQAPAVAAAYKAPASKPAPLQSLLVWDRLDGPAYRFYTPAEISTLEAAYQECKPTCDLIVSGKHCVVDFNSWSHKDDGESGGHRVRRLETVTWKWMHDGIWLMFARDQIFALETALRAGKTDVNLRTGKAEFSVDFDDLEMINTTTRARYGVKRIPSRLS